MKRNNSKYMREYYHKHRRRLIAYQKMLQQQRRQWVNKIKQQPCADCGFCFHPAAMQFHHVRGKKSFTIGSRIKSVSRGALEAEIAKCVLLCANCHAIRENCPPTEWELERLLSQWEKTARMRPAEYRFPKCWKCGRLMKRGMYHIFFRGGLREAHLCRKCGKPYVEGK